LPVDFRQQCTMRSLAQVAIHHSQFPENVRRDLVSSLRARQLNHKFLYDGYKQTQKWLALHEAFSPARNNVDCVETYAKAFAAAAQRLVARGVHVISLGCGGGQKDVSLLKQLRQSGKQVSYTPADVSVAMVLTAREAALELLEPGDCFPLVCDLLTTDDLPEVLRQQTPADDARLVAFFGLIPNFEPRLILPRLAELLLPNDYLLLSANLAPGNDYAAGMERVRPLYDNSLTRVWLMTFLSDLGVEPGDGQLVFSVQECAEETGLKRIVASFHFERARKVRVLSDEIEFATGEPIRLFFSYRHTPELVRGQLKRHGLVVLEQWICPSEEEGVFLCARSK